MQDQTPDTPDPEPAAAPAGTTLPQPSEPELGGPKEKQPTRYGDWTVKGRCIDF